MKKIFFVIASLLLSFATQAKYVKFSVDMSSVDSINATGVHIGGTFQALPGIPGDVFSSDSLPMFPESAGSMIYSIILNLPANQMYEYRFYNGDQTYDTEFIPEKSRVSLDDDNRWIFIDSVANDTTFVGAIIFGGNAPAGKSLVRMYVGIDNVTLASPDGIHAAGSINALNNGYSQMYSFGNNVYQTMYYVTNGTYNYKFYNGINTSETIQGSCAVNGMREVNVSSDTLLNKVCFGECDTCNLAGIRNYSATASHMNVFPNPTVEKAYVIFDNAQSNRMIYVFDSNGAMVTSLVASHQKTISIDCSQFAAGVYEVVAVGNNTMMDKHKLVITK
jgi:hypothetical protein